jgi:arsenate reductase
VANSSRSQMAEGFLRALAPPGALGMERGLVTDCPLAVSVMREVGVDISSQRAKAISEIPKESVTTVITLCAEEVCPAWLTPAERLHWPLEDPAAVRGDEAMRRAAFRRVRHAIQQRIDAFLADL